MLEFLKGKVSDRKLRLFACAFWRSREEFLYLTDDITQHAQAAVETAERYADGLARLNELAPFRGLGQGVASGRGITAAQRTLLAIHEKVFWLPEMPAGKREHQWTAAEQLVVRRAQEDRHRGRLADWSSLARETFGNPFRPVTVNPAWLSWCDGTIPKLAEAIYDERAFDRMPIFGDALEDAGCEDQNILRHCRQRGAVHVRGCFVLDLLLDKE
jgi:hypothetical protein